ncbi:type III secretion protein HrpI [[Pantoea] beijingensis]|uniref:Type III secretion protein HrpI n=1 Tax=[Pantoea] beijingensis TaxID=1324864 RepID=A0A443IAG9_9GAMM|nr:type III secretion system export apparatus subunit SctV [[Pantoea] beijingensis]RWR00980.1 type III secretion protein HrpI [[Pantoea] beijingensis]
MNTLFNLLNKIAISAMQRSEIVGAAIALAIVFMLIIPLPLPLIDVLIAVNISLSSLLIVLAMYLPKPLAFSTFPAVLLLTTMFRMALSISTTRQILLQQNAGHIVQAFGDFVVGGNLAVGLVVFLILTVVNFLVITKGSERVAEVAARFTLDAMPGKQMSIDSDLRAGMINVQQAKNRREDLAKESQLFGAMDGAMKFVKGDAISGLVILFINMIGGFCIGVLQLGMEAGDAMHTYSILTIGDGLIAQIPALLISLTAGMIITRVSGNEEIKSNNIGREITDQLTSQPKAWIISSFGMLCFALLPGMPTVIFIILAAITCTTGSFQLWRASKQAVQVVREQVENITPDMNGSEDIRSFNPARYFVLSFPAARHGDPIVDKITEGVRRLRNRIVYRYGFTLPSFHVEYIPTQPEDEFRFSIYEIPKITATLSNDRYAVEAGLLTEEQRNDTDGRTPGIERRNESQFLWFGDGDSLRQQTEIKVWSASELLLERMEQALFANSSRFIGLQETRSILNWLEAEHAELAQEFQRILPLPRLSAVLQRLVAERVSLRSVRGITESLIEHGQHERDINLLVDQVRIDIKEQICHQYASEGGISVWLLTPETEEILRDSLRQTQNDTFFALEQQQHTQLLEYFKDLFPLFEPLSGVLLTAQDLRSPLRMLIQDEFNHVPVLSFAELQFDLSVNVLGRIELNTSSESFNA